MFYVYLIIDPVRNEPFYVGKGKGCRASRHLRSSPNKRVKIRISRLREKGRVFRKRNRKKKISK